MNQPPEIVNRLVEERHKELLSQYQLTKVVRSLDGHKPEPWAKWLIKDIRSIYRILVDYFKPKSSSMRTLSARSDLSECQNLSECHCG
jgi:hypothetical protein